jgi:protein TonB
MNDPRIALYEFMPYGAPELLEYSRRHLTRALSTASALVVAAYMLVLVAAPFFAHPAAPEIRLERIFNLAPPPPLTDAPTAPRIDPATPVAPPAAAVPVPVPDAEVVIPATIPSQLELGRSGPGENAVPAGPGLVVAPPVEETPPDPGVFVLAEEYPTLVTRVAPVYPDLARSAGVDGRVVVLALVGKDGRIKDARIAKSVPMLDEAALAAVRQWVFTPALNGGHPVLVWVRVPVVFTLH